MQHIAIIGGGFAGVWAAIAADELRRANPEQAKEIQITLINPRDELVIRPRLYEVDPGSKTVLLASVLQPRNISHRKTLATTIDSDAQQIITTNKTGETHVISYDRLILASGSRLTKPTADSDHLFDIDTVETATIFDRHLHELGSTPAKPGRSTVVVIGAGFTGIEIATELRERLGSILGHSDDNPSQAVRVVLVERSDVVGPELGEGPRPAITQALKDTGVEVKLGTTLLRYDGSIATFDDGSTLETNTVLWTAGMRADDLTTQIPGARDGLGRLKVDQTLLVSGLANHFAAGDTAAPLDESGHVVTQSCQHAMPQGTCAGHNAVADLLGLPLKDLETMPYQTCLDLGSAGAVYSQGWDREVKLTGDEANTLKQNIVNLWIYPPATV